MDEHEVPAATPFVAYVDDKVADEIDEYGYSGSDQVVNEDDEDEEIEDDEDALYETLGLSRDAIPEQSMSLHHLGTVLHYSQLPNSPQGLQAEGLRNTSRPLAARRFSSSAMKDSLSWKTIFKASWS